MGVPENVIPWELYTTKSEALDALACREMSPNWKPMPPSLGIVTRDGGTTMGPRPHFFTVDEVDMVTCIEVSYEGVSWEWENERVYEQLDPVISLISELGRDRILVDCARLDYLDRCFLSILLQLWNKIRHVNGRFAFCNVNQNILDVILAMKLPLRIASEH